MAKDDEKEKTRTIAHKIARELNQEPKVKTLVRKPDDALGEQQAEMQTIVDGAAPPPQPPAPVVPGAPLPSIQFGQGRDYLLVGRALQLLIQRLTKRADEVAGDQYVKEANIIRSDIDSIKTQILPKLAVQQSVPFPDDEHPARAIETVIRPIVVKLRNPKVKMTETEATRMLVQRIAEYGIECAEKGFHMGNQAREMSAGRIAVLSIGKLRDAEENKPANV